MVLRMYRSRTAKNTCTEMDLICTEVVMYRKCPPLCTETVMYRKRRNPQAQADNQASGRAYGSAGVGSSLLISQRGVWSVGGRLIILVRVRPRRRRSLARPITSSDQQSIHHTQKWRISIITFRLRLVGFEAAPMSA